MKPLNFLIPAVSSFSPDTNGLVLLRQMLTISIVVIESLHIVHGVAKKVLCTASWSQIGILTGILCNLRIVEPVCQTFALNDACLKYPYFDGPCPCGNICEIALSSQGKHELGTLIMTYINIH